MKATAFRCNKAPGSCTTMASSWSCLSGSLASPCHAAAPLVNCASRLSQASQGTAACARRVVHATALPDSGNKLDREITVWPLKTPIPMRAYVAIEAVVAVATLGLVDAAYSGDWSRIGVITTDLEDKLKLLVAFIAVVHTGTAAAAAYFAQQNGSSPALAAVKGFVFGSLGLYEVMQDNTSKL